MSSQLLSEEPARHTFMHDLESFLWVLVWLVAVHAREYNQHNANLLREKLCSPDDSFKSFFIANSDRARAQMLYSVSLDSSIKTYIDKEILHLMTIRRNRNRSPCLGQQN
ncbi:hypothetical protein AG1IA_10406 [Rhizoctonia solani AG-1 IA]|uniref:Fungal-type protein kinase domain-containing protein n=1 Tax=Thanatephorus cucumeris (strain AG1-IA) TaxID=983506 RepID=L8WGN8_THACA|nr:hypothetical protein AG1IA_10406 [Rhizoctonia solani AG-1 IA]